MTEHLPVPDTRRFPRLTTGDVRVLEPGHLLTRIYPAGGSHPTTWSAFRRYGPTGSRFDHHPDPPGVHPGHGVMYAAPVIAEVTGTPYPSLMTCLAEVFRDSGVVDTHHDAPYAAVFAMARALRLLDLGDSDWLTRAGGNGAISSGPREPARAWARAVHAHYQGGDAVDGLLYPSSHIPVARSAVLWERAEDALPDQPSLNLPLSHPGLRAALETYAGHLGLGLTTGT